MLIARPTEVFKEYVRSTGRVDEISWELGRMSMALEMVTQMMILQDLNVASDVGRAEAVTALSTLLQDCGMEEVAFQMYRKLGRWRTTRFVAVPEPSQPTIAVSDGQLSMDLSSSAASPAPSTSRRGKPRALPSERRSLRAVPTDEPTV